MNSSIQNTLRPALVLFFLLSIVTGLAYPYLTTGIGQALFPAQANGSLISVNGKPVGSALIGQQFSDPGHFWGRLSATSPMPYNAANSGGSNLGPLNPALLDAVKGRIDALKAADPDNKQPIPVDLVTASGSGLDPDISAAAAFYQVARVAKARKLDPEQLRLLVGRQVQHPILGLIGETSVNVLQLNLALDSMR